jgi:hypothetical protein
MPVQVFNRSDPSRNKSQAKWFTQLREEHLRLEPGVAHEFKLPERGVAQLCRHCRKATRESIWVARCGPCGKLFSPVLAIFTACEHCGGAAGAVEQLREHEERLHA